jgi:hypothetical protein
MKVKLDVIPGLGTDACEIMGEPVTLNAIFYVAPTTNPTTKPYN